MTDFPIPPIIRDLISKLNNATLEIHERDNVVVTVEAIGAICTREAERYRRSRAVDYEEDRRKKKGRR